MTTLLQTPRPAGGYRVIMADPPWAFVTRSKSHTTPHRGADDHYKTLTFDDLKDLPVGEMAARDCCLFVWVVRSHLPEAIELGRAWGFQYKTRAFVWDKGDRIGMGYWTRTQAEDVLLFTRGAPRVASRSVREIIRAPRREHSRKPDEIYQRVEQLTGHTGLELFARQSWPGWVCWGNDTARFTAPESETAQTGGPVCAAP